MKYIFTLFYLCIGLSLAAQMPKPRIYCGNEILSDMMRNQYPEWKRAVDHAFEDAKSATGVRSDEPLTIKVVIHVVWNQPEENLHDSIIYDQVDVLNEDYNRQNADTVNLREIFQNEAGNPNIQFEVAAIVRVQTSEIFSVDILGGSLLPELKNTEDGGSDAWDPTSYLNIWICKIQPITIFGLEVGQILGFAFPPAGLKHWPEGVAAPTPGEDGVALDYRIVGRNNPNSITRPDGTGEELVVRGRSASHEVGHYLGLRHIWGDGGTLGPNDCLQSDGIDDTPFADAQSAFDCDKTKNSCSQIETHYQENVPDMVENYMDYASEDCMNMFTNGQASLMRNVLTGPRSGLLEKVSSVKPVAEYFDLTISPNPVDNILKISLAGIDANDVVITLYNLQGKITSVSLNKQDIARLEEISINVDGFAPGIYFLEMKTGDKAGVAKVMIK